MLTGRTAETSGRRSILSLCDRKIQKIKRRRKISIFLLCVLSFSQYLLTTKGFHPVFGTQTSSANSLKTISTNNESKFGPIPISLPLFKRLQRAGLTHPTSIQKASMPSIFSTRNTIIHAETGSGKTLAYLLPVISRLVLNNSHQIKETHACKSYTKILIIVPSRELASQVARWVEALAPIVSRPLDEKGKRGVAALIITSQAIRKKTRMILQQKRPFVIVGTPLGIYRVLNGNSEITKSIWKSLRAIILDEVDSYIPAELPSECAGVHILQRLRAELTSRGDPRVDSYKGKNSSEIFKHISTATTIQIICASATIPFQVRKVMAECLGFRNRKDVGVVISVPPSHQPKKQYCTKRGLGQVSIVPLLKHTAVVCRRTFEGELELEGEIQEGNVTELRRIEKHRSNSTKSDPIENSDQSIIPTNSRNRLQKNDSLSLKEAKWRMLGHVWDVMCPSRALILVPNDYSPDESLLEMKKYVTNASCLLPSVTTRLGLLTPSSMSEHKSRKKEINIASNGKENNSANEIGLETTPSTWQLWRKDRKAVIANFRSARGLDLKRVGHVFILSVPSTADSYLHLAGRTGREGTKGMVVTLVDEKERSFIQKHADELGVPLNVIDLEKEAKIQQKLERRQRIHDELTKRCEEIVEESNRIAKMVAKEMPKKGSNLNLEKAKIQKKSSENGEDKALSTPKDGKKKKSKRKKISE